MRILICDDDALIVEQLQKYIRNFFEKIGEQQKKYEWISNLSKTANGTLTGKVKMDFEA